MWMLVIFSPVIFALVTFLATFVDVYAQEPYFQIISGF